MKKHLLAMAAMAVMSGSAYSMYLVGDPAGEWSPAKGIEMTQTDGGWSWTGNIGSGQWFAFATQLDESGNWDNFNANYRLNPPANGTVATTGEYALSLGGSDMSFKGAGAECTFLITENGGNYTLNVTLNEEPVEPTKVQLALRGSMNDWGFSEDYYFTETADGIYTYTLATLAAGSQFKIADDSWSNEYTTWNTAMQPGVEYAVGSGGDNMGVAEDFSNVVFTLNTNDNTLVFTIDGGASSETLPAPDPDQVIVDDEPEGTEVLYSRTCEALREMYGEVERIIEEGSIVSHIQQEDGTVWLGNAVSMYRLQGWVKATKDGDYLTIQGPQLVYQEPDYDSDDWDAMINYYLTAVEEYEYVNEEGETMRSYRATPDGMFRFKIDGNTLKQDGDGSLILGVCGYNDADGYYFTGYGDRYDVLTVPELKPVELPADAEVKKGWAMTYSDVDDLENGRVIDVAINGDDYYVKGMYEGLPEAWVKGSKKDDTIVFDNYQMVGPDFDWGYFVYLAGGQMVSLDGDYYLDDATIEEGGYSMTINEDGSWDADNDVIFITSPQTNPENANYLAAYIGMNIKEQDLSTLTNPVAPDDGSFGGLDGVPAVEFNLPPLDENGNLLDTNNLYFRIFVNDSNQPYTFDPDTYWYDLPEMDIWEPVTELPYDIPDNGYDMYQVGAWHTVYIYSDEAVSSLGVQAVYYPEGREENPENVLYSVIAVFDDPNSVDSIISGKEVKNVTFFNLMGQKEANPSAGVYIKHIEFADGTVKTLKVTHR